MGQSAAQYVTNPLATIQKDKTDVLNAGTMGFYGYGKEAVKQIQDPMGLIKTNPQYQADVQQKQADALYNQQKSASDAQAQSADAARTRDAQYQAQVTARMGASGYAGTILTSPLGVPSAPTSSAKTLLGS